ncbi:DUF2515 family protein [Brevibacillus choshinensis]|uniref:DUF2515 family protein n=1 Tax=Brevibacillus choshinensis TaxID=54911 RepID=A0ABX7FGN7_BRECH|nr:DUF2515 family protein [Brevibacillus choshinensis]QRG65356.1 DUF2515 family protein [Brevibacillus choshinensis]
MTKQLAGVDTQELVSRIRQQTTLANRNNVTRTQAYLEFYRQHEEIHWALLAHLVSRNGGWNMTDLKGEWLPLLLDEQAIQPFFWFLERSNWLIFHDAYAQLLLYAEMKRTGTDLTALLLPLGVSGFMQPFWRDFLETNDSGRLTHAMIVNEQQYIEQRVIHKPITLHLVFATFAYFTQSVLSLSQVLFPYKAHPTDRRLSLVGLDVQHFPKVEERIATGKTLYRILYGDANRLEQIRQFTFRIPHSGSRADYWPQLFTVRAPEQPAQAPYELRLNGTGIREGQKKLYSPPLTVAWKDVSHTAADGVDWFRDPKWLEVVDLPGELPAITSEDYVRALQWMEYGIKLVTAIT